MLVVKAVIFTSTQLSTTYYDFDKLKTFKYVVPSISFVHGWNLGLWNVHNIISLIETRSNDVHHQSTHSFRSFGHIRKWIAWTSHATRGESRKRTHHARRLAEKLRTRWQSSRRWHR